jgi:phytoene dehydrogenase-like protein
MGELEGRKSAWAYVEGGMGKLSQAIADSATSMGTTVLTNKVVHSQIIDHKFISIINLVPRFSSPFH